MNIVNMILPNLLIVLTIITGIVSVISKKKQIDIQKQKELLKDVKSYIMLNNEENYVVSNDEENHIIYLEDNTKDKKKRIVLKEGDNFFGRDPEKVNYVLKNIYVSRVHFVIKVHGGQMLIQDCNSANGTYLNEKELTSEPTILKEGDIIRVGGIYLTVYK